MVKINLRPVFDLPFLHLFQEMPDSTTESASATAANHNDDAGDPVAGPSGEQVLMINRLVSC